MARFIAVAIPAPLLGALRAAVHAVDKDQAVGAIRPLEDIVGDTIARQRFAMTLLTVFSGVALVIAAVGIYGVMAYNVVQRTGEFGIRMALGAERQDVLKLVVRQGMTLATIGVATGVIASIALTGLMSSLLFGVSATDPLTFAGVALILGCVALIACYVPARRATKVDPLVALRYE